MKRFLGIVLFVMMVPCLCFAETSEWKDRQFCFGDIKTIVYGLPSSEPNVQDQFARQKVADYFQSAFGEKKSALRFISLQEVTEMIGRDVGVDMVAIGKIDFQRYKKLFIENAPKFCDAIMTANVMAMGYGKIRRDASVSAWTSTQTNNYTINGSLYSVTEPVTNFSIDPAHDVTIVNGGLSITLISLNTGKTIWGYTDVRDRTNKKLSSTNPDEMMRRIVASSVDRMMNLFKKQE